MKTAIKLEPMDVNNIPFQEASLDIWRQKYRLSAKDGTAIDQSMDETYQRVARALAEVEQAGVREHWYERFLWALRKGSIPAGRIISNAGAVEHKPATSTINCTVSGTIHDSMDDILAKVHEAGLTLKAGCVAPGTWVLTERGLVTADDAVAQRHAEILSYDRDARRFEMRRIERHMTTRVPRNENIELVANGVSLRTSVRHPVLVYRSGRLMYVRADEVDTEDALVQHAFAWTGAAAHAQDAWFAGAYLGGGSAHAKRMSYLRSRMTWTSRTRAIGEQLASMFHAAERAVVERCGAFLQSLCDSRAQAFAGTAQYATPAWHVAAAGRAAAPIGTHVCGESAAVQVPDWIKARPDAHFLPFLAGLIDGDGVLDPEHGSVTVSMHNQVFAGELQALLNLFGVHGSITRCNPRRQRPGGNETSSPDGVEFGISDTAFLARVAEYMTVGVKRSGILAHTGGSGQRDRYRLPDTLRAALLDEAARLTHGQRRELGFLQGHHTRTTVSRMWLDRWERHFPRLAEMIRLARTLRPVVSIRRNLPLPETFFDFTVEKHNNYLAGNNGLLVIHNCGIGYEFSTMRPRGAYVSGAGAYTSGPLSFMDIYDKMCFTVSSAGGRRGAQMGTFDIGHPDAMDFIRAKREAGRLRQFNLSLLITDEFMQAVKADQEWRLAFPVSLRELADEDLHDSAKYIWRDWPIKEGYITNEAGQVCCKIYKVLPARRMWDVIMSSTYDFAEPGFVLIDRVNEMNNNWWCENIRATNPCGEQPLPPYGSCLLGSVNLTRFVLDPFTDDARFDWEAYREVVKVFTRLLDNVVEINGLPLGQQRNEITRKRRHGMGFLGLGSAITMQCMKYGSRQSVAFTQNVAREMAIAGWEEGLSLAREKGPAPIMLEEFEVTHEMLHKRPEMKRDGWRAGQTIPGRVLHARYSKYMQRIAEAAPELVDELAEVGARFTHHSSIAPTGTISLSLANNASNGIEPSFAHHYFRNVIREGKKSKEKIDVFSFELLAYRELINPHAMPNSSHAAEQLPAYFTTADDITPKEHVDIQAAAQIWVDSSISKTANVPTDYDYEDFKDIYLYAHEQGLKGCTTFRFNPEAFQGVLVKEQDLKNTTYVFTLEDGTEIKAKGDEEIEYDGEMHSAANLFDALKEGYYGKF